MHSIQLFAVAARIYPPDLALQIKVGICVLEGRKEGYIRISPRLALIAQSLLYFYASCVVDLYYCLLVPLAAIATFKEMYHRSSTSCQADEFCL